MANSKVVKKQKPANEYNTDDLSSDDDWIVDSDGSSDNFDLDLDFPNEQDFVQIGEDAGRVLGAPKDDLEIPDFDDDEDNDGDEDGMEDDDSDGDELKYFVAV